MMFCYKCGTQIPDGSAFCPGCGNKIEAAPAAPVAVAPVVPAAPVEPVAPVVPVAPVEPVAPVVPVAPVATVAPIYPAAPVSPQPPQQKKSLAWLYILIVAVVLLVGIFAALYFCTDLFKDSDNNGGKKKEKDEPTTSQTDPSGDPTDNSIGNITQTDPNPPQTTAPIVTPTEPIITPTTPPSDSSVRDIETIAKRFALAFEFDDYVTQCQLMLHDLKEDLRDQVLEDFASEEEFFSQQSQRYGVSIDSWDDVFTAIHNALLTEADEVFGEYTIGYDITESRWLTSTEMDNFMSEYVDYYGDYVADYTLNSIDTGYVVTLNFSINGELDTYSCVYEVYLVEHEGQWMVADYFFPEEEY